MCGINGIIFKKNILEFEKITQMNSMLAHRGPDFSGTLSHKNILLGHTRLSILDTTQKGAQPMSNDGRYWIIYNGEVYNYLELKEQLIGKNYKFYTSTDTEVILCAYKEWGDKCFEKFNGEWALSILDKKKDELIICRDGIGYKPCYIYDDQDYFSFSSEIKSFYCLKNSLDFDNSNLGVSAETLSYSSKTVFNNIIELVQGRYLKINLKTFQRKLVRWDFPLKKLPNINPSYKKNTERYFDLLKKATKLRLRSDVQIGTSLSGGLDSSAIFSLLNILSEQSETKDKLNLNPIIMNYDTMRSKNEALELAELYKKNALVIEDKEENIEQTKNIISKLEITEEFFMQYNLYFNQKKRGVKVSIDGHGSDEFLGYPQYFPEYSVDIFNNMIGNHNALSKYGNEQTKIRMQNLFGLRNNIPNQIKFRVAPDNKNYFSKYLEFKNYVSDSLTINDDLDELENFSYSLAFTYLISYCGWFQYFLNKWDRASMANSVEVRMPFLDNDVRLFSLALNTDHKIRNSNSKSILRDSFKNLIPKSIIEQSYKQGLTQHKFDLNNKKYTNFINNIINQNNFINHKAWDSKKILKDFNSNKNYSIIWRISKYYLMVEGFKDSFDFNKPNKNYMENSNNLIKN